MAMAYEGGIDTYQSVTYGQPHQGTLNFLQTMVETPTQMLNDVGQRFMSTVRESFDYFSGEGARRRLRAAGNIISSRWDADVIKPLATLDELQVAPPSMHRWLMAEPTIRHLYHNNQCDGYGDSYVDLEPGKIGEEHSDWRMVMDGIVQETDDGWYFNQYIEDTLEEDVELLADEQFDILRSWEAMATAALNREEDPTSKWNADLG